MTDTDEYDRHVGENLRKLRLARGLNQDQLAAQVAERGIPFRQQTIVKIEKGQRPLRLREADAITAILDVDIDALVDEELVIDWAALLMSHTRQVAENWETLIGATKELLIRQENVRHDLKVVREKGIAVEDGILNEAATMLQVDPVKVVAAVPKQLEAERAVQSAEYDAGVDYVRHDEVENRG